MIATAPGDCKSWYSDGIVPAMTNLAIAERIVVGGDPDQRAAAPVAIHQVVLVNARLVDHQPRHPFWIRSQPIKLRVPTFAGAGSSSASVRQAVIRDNAAMCKTAMAR